MGLLPRHTPLRPGIAGTQNHLGPYMRFSVENIQAKWPSSRFCATEQQQLPNDRIRTMRQLSRQTWCRAIDMGNLKAMAGDRL